jgi:S1-C subfamily serine protease
MVCFLIAVMAVAPTLARHDVSEVYEQVKNSVVVIHVAQKELADGPGMSKMVSVQGLGSGVLISEDGKILTAAHVVQTADRIAVRFKSGEAIPARVLAAEPAADIAVIQLAKLPSRPQVAKLGNSDAIRIGERIFVVGAPLGIEHTLTVGYVSARRGAENLGGLVPAELLQTDAAINEGNSGGPMFNLDGEVVGIVSHIITHSGGFEGLGFAVSSNTAREMVLDRRSMWSGVESVPLEGPLAEALNVPQKRAALVQKVADNSLGAHLGLRAGTMRGNLEGQQMLLGGDVILAVMGVSLDEPDAYGRIRELMNGVAENDRITVKVLRGGEIVDLHNFYFKSLLVPEAPGTKSRK